MYRAFLAVFITASALLNSVSASSEVLGCGGFVKSAKSNIDLSRIQIGLYARNSKTGHLRQVELTDCAPNNGYYFIPVTSEDVGEYVLKAMPPRGWKVVPAEFNLAIDGQTDECSTGKDVNFEFIGFGVTGSVLSKGSDKGPKGIDVELVSEKSRTVLSATTDEDGKFVFFGVTPGTYTAKIASSHVSLYAFDAQSRKLEVGDDVSACPPFQILGYSLDGHIQSVNGDGLSSIKLDLYSGTKVSATCLSDKTGFYRFPGVPVGQYVIRVSDTSTMELVNKEILVQVGHENVHVDNFVVSSFTLKGTVVSSSKKPLQGVKLSINHGGGNQNNVQLSSDNKGQYKIKGITSGPVTIKPSLDGYDFQSVTFSKFNPQSDLPPINPSRYRLSGHVDRSGFQDISSEIKVKFVSDEEEVGKVLVSQKGGAFSIYLASGHYKVSVITADTSTNTIGFAPLVHQVEIKDGPIEGLKFLPVKADVEGVVQCLLSSTSCTSTNLQVTLTLDHGIIKSSQTVAVSNSRFKFTGILPGTYTLAVSEDNKCWEQPIQTVSVSKDISDIVFKQVGYYVSVESPRSTLLLFQDHKSGSFVQESVISSGHNVICVKGNADLVNLSTKGCEEFEIEPAQVQLPLEKSVTLKPVKYQVTGRIVSKNAIKDLSLVAKSELRQVEVDNMSTFENGQYNFVLSAFPGEEVLFSPRSQEHLFDPESLHVFVDHDCHLDSVSFSATTGYFLQGKVQPPVEDVTINIVKAAPNAKHTTTNTDAKGQFKLGPLPPDFDYEVEAVKEGYLFEHLDDKHNFRSKQLASIHVKLENNLSGAVISVSGGDNYRSNTLTKDGQAAFLSLSPGEYFVKPQLKEYEFEPKHQLLNLQEGQSAKVNLRSKRVAFSIFGKLVSLNGEAEQGITLKARSESGHTEEATSEQQGEFRFRGLKPNCKYTIGLGQSDKGDIEKVIPDQTNVDMGQEDFHLKRPLVAIRAVETMDISLKVSEDQKSSKATAIKVSMVPEVGSGYNFNTKSAVGRLVVLPTVPKDGKKYVLTVESIPEKFSPQKRVSTIIKADEYYKFVGLTLNKTDTTTRPVRKASVFLYVLPLILIGLLTFALWDKRPAFVRKLFDGGSSSSSPAYVSNDNVASAAAGGGFDTPSVRKRNKKRT